MPPKSPTDSADEANVFMAMGTREGRRRQEGFWLTHDELATAPGHPFYQRLNQLLDEEKFDRFAEGECAQFYAEKNGRRH